MITVKNLTKKFNDNIVLDDVSVEFKEGKIYGLIGRNGSGKSVFLKLLCGFYNPNSGSILYDNIDICKSLTFPPDTRCMIEKPDFISELTGFENLRMLAKIQNRINDEKILQTMEEVNLHKEIYKPFYAYSLGSRQKLGIAQVLMENPKVIILDEPFNGIEASTTALLREKLKEEKKQGKIIIIATHMKEDIENLVDDIYEFSDGKLNKK